MCLQNLHSPNQLHCVAITWKQTKKKNSKVVCRPFTFCLFVTNKLKFYEIVLVAQKSFSVFSSRGGHTMCQLIFLPQDISEGLFRTRSLALPDFLFARPDGISIIISIKGFRSLCKKVTNNIIAEKLTYEFWGLLKYFQVIGNISQIFLRCK